MFGGLGLVGKSESVDHMMPVCGLFPQPSSSAVNVIVWLLVAQKRVVFQINMK